MRRLVYPDGPHDAETLLLPADGRPVIVTKDLGGRSGVYTTDVPPAGPSPTPLRRVGQLVVPPTSTEGGPVGPLGPFGRGLYTGGALSADGRVAAVRTYTDAFLFPVAGGTADDVVAALRDTPVTVALPGEPQGEAIAFTADGTLLSAGESGSGRGPGTAQVRAVPGATGLVAAAAARGATAPAPAAATAGAPGSDGSTPEAGAPAGVLVGAVAVGVVAVLLVAGVAVLAVRAMRPRRRGRR